MVLSYIAGYAGTDLSRVEENICKFFVDDDLKTNTY